MIKKTKNKIPASARNCTKTIIQNHNCGQNNNNNAENKKKKPCGLPKQQTQKLIKEI